MELQSSGDGPTARCALCGAGAAGPCARCRRLVCADCSELVTGGAGTFAVCTRCSGASVGYRPLLRWIGLVVGVLVAVAAALVLLRR